LTSTEPESDGSVADLDSSLKLRRENVVKVDQPLALICQAQRSGGTLLATLFDGHPQCHVHPHELRIGVRGGHTWPRLKPNESAETWYSRLREEQLSVLFVKGRRKIPLKAPGEKSKEMGSYPFLLPPSFQHRLFLEEVERREPASEREVLDCYMTALFNAWLDNQNLVSADKRWVVAFSPRRAWGEGLRRFFKLYPDGRLISILRDPWSWFTSAQGRDPHADVDELLKAWRRSATEMVRARGEFRDRVLIVRFEDLLLDTGATMRHVAGFLEIDFDPQLLRPTFNRYPVGANSSYDVRSTGIVADPIARHETLLSEDARDRIAGACGALYKQVLKLSAPAPPAPVPTLIESSR
jgi:hypothetical protein